MNEREAESEKRVSINWVWFLFSFRGRINRKQYWFFNVIIIAGWIIIQLLTSSSYDVNEISKPQLMYALWICWPQFAVHAKRWHDINKSGLWLLVEFTILLPLPVFMSILGPLWAFIQNGFIRGTPGPNRFGPDPLEEEVK